MPVQQAAAPSLWRRLTLTLDMIKFEHSVFALPFALTGALLALRGSGLRGGAAAWKLGLIVLAMVTARSTAMAFNRVLDADIDARNPRTAMRHLPAGLLSLRFAWAFTAVTGILFVLAAALLNPLCLWLSPVALLVISGYSYTKRFTAAAHLVLGFALGIAPAAAWIAIRGTLDVRILWLTAAVMLWTAGFDIIYACQDFEFDVRHRLFSVPSRIGIAKSLWASRVLHVLMIGCLLSAAAAFGMGGWALLGVVSVVALLCYEHSLVKADDLSRVNAAFFTVNGYVSVLFFAFWAADLWKG